MYEKKGRYIVEFPDIPGERQHQIEIEVDERRGNYNEVELGFDEARAAEEARRCLSCRRCLGCALCWAECKPEAIVFEMEDEDFYIQADEVVISPGAERAVGQVGPQFGLGRHFNVVTDLVLERMLSEDGPTSGMVIRPFDGELPSSLAFVQGYGSIQPELHLAALCLGVNEALLVRRALPDADVRFFAAGLGPFLEKHKEGLKRLDGVLLKESFVEKVEAAEDHNLKLTIAAAGGSEEKVFDMVVLLTAPQLSQKVKDLAKDLGVNLDYASFLRGERARLIDTEDETVKLARQG